MSEEGFMRWKQVYVAEYSPSPISVDIYVPATIPLDEMVEHWSAARKGSTLGFYRTRDEYGTLGDETEARNQYGLQFLSEVTDPDEMEWLWFPTEGDRMYHLRSLLGISW